MQSLGFGIPPFWDFGIPKSQIPQSCTLWNSKHAHMRECGSTLYVGMGMCRSVRLVCNMWHIWLLRNITNCCQEELWHNLCYIVYSLNSVCMWVSLPLVHAGGVENSVILVGSGSDTEGYVMIYAANSWFYLVAHPDYWTDTHAGVVCRQLGYSGGMVPNSTSGYRWALDMYGLHMHGVCVPLVNPSLSTCLCMLC